MVPKASASSARLARGNFAVAQESALLADADQRADVVEQIDEEKYENELAQAEFRRRAQIELEKRPGWDAAAKKDARASG